MAKQDTEFPKTRGSLLLQLKSAGDEDAWREFVDIYKPVIYRIARRRGLQDADAQDLVQKVLVAVAGAIGNWEQRAENIRFRHWLRRVAQNAILNAVTRRAKDTAAGGTVASDLLAEQPTPDVELECEVALEHRRELFQRAALLVRSEVADDTWEVFQLAVVENIPIEEVATKIGKSVGAAYACRGRVMNRLRRTVAQMQEEAK